MHGLLTLAIALMMTKPLAHDAASSLKALRAIDVDREMPDTDVPPLVAQLMKNAKHDLRDLAGAALNAQSGDAKALIIEALAEEGVDTDEKSCDCMGDYGRLLTLDVAPLAGHRDIVAVEITLSLPCGDDSALYLFRNGRLVYQREADDYQRVGQGLGSFSWRASAEDANGSFLVITTSISPACISMWQWLTYSVDRVTPWCNDAEEIARGGSSIYDGWDNLDVDVKPDGYSLHFNAASFDTDMLVRPYRITMHVDGDRLTRIDPVADSPRDFVEEWLAMTDDDAQRWSDAAAPRPLNENTLRSFGPIRQCADGLWQVRVDDQPDFESDEFTSIYFIVSAKEKVFRLIDIRDEARDGCPDEVEPATDDEASPSPPEAPRDRS